MQDNQTDPDDVKGRMTEDQRPTRDLDEVVILDSTQMQTTRRFTLVELETAITSVGEEIMSHVEAGEDVPLDLLSLMTEGMQTVTEKRDRIAGFLRRAESEAEFIDQEIKRLTRRKQVIENASFRLVDYIHNWMRITGIQELKGRMYTIKLAKVADSCEVYEVDKLPDRFIQDPKPQPKLADKKALLAEMKTHISEKEFQTTIKDLDDQGKLIAIRKMISTRFPGANILNGKTRLSIK